ncbi:chitinase [Tessaracoccus palaemonis]|nr:carbohydrate-binding protein [Tessaracoccus palaemonis]
MSTRYSGRRLSPVRLVVLLAVVAALISGLVYAYSWTRDALGSRGDAHWFSAYVDVTATPTYTFEAATEPHQKIATLGFVVASSPTTCEASWGTYYSLDGADGDLDLTRRIARLTRAGGDVIVSLGGAANSELALVCDSVADLQAQYRAVVDTYSLETIDFDIEGTALDDTAANQRRAEAVAALQQERAAAGDDPLKVWVTLPVSADGLPASAVAVVTAFLDAGVDLAGVNAMTMDFGGGDAARNQADVAIAALRRTHDQLVAIYADRGESLGDREAWARIGATPMIGQNDVVSEVFSLDNARALNEFATEVGLGRMSMWSANRDRTCSDAYADVTVVSDSCSGVEQDDESFGAILAKGFTSSGDAPSPTPSASASATARADQVVDDPSTSPYPVWAKESSYPQGTRIVWRRNVYEAKWWTQGDQPDDPTVAASDTPWRLIGPVLEGESPSPEATLPADFFPTWDAATVYDKGDEVMLDGGAYRARWWTQGDNPASGQVNPGTSPWEKLTSAEITKLLKAEG